MSAFPTRKNEGTKEIHYGIQFSFDSPRSLAVFLARLLPVGSNDDPISDIESAAADLAKVSKTERDSLIKSRIGQGPFRAKLNEYWGNCAVTDFPLPEILRASHIKPWKLSNNVERLDPYNGLLLTANLDALFDRGLLSFRDDGTMVLSPRILPEYLEILGIPITARLRRIDPKHMHYLEYHRSQKLLS